METRLTQATWRKSSYSGGSGNCVEIAGDLPGAVGVRDSKDPGGQALVFTTVAWRAFAAQVKSGKRGQQLARRQHA
jgi:Domain of unknown function (DUF397)